VPVHRELQTAFAAGLTSGVLPEGVVAHDPAEVAQRFAVYRNNVGHSLIQALATKFPVIQRLVGEAFFAQMARLFADTNRPKTPVLMLWGDAFPGFLAEFAPLAAYPYMADVARIEVARGVAYHASDVQAISADRLQQLAASGGNGSLALHPSVQLISSRHPVVTLWQTNQPGQTPHNMANKGPETALVLRTQTFDVVVHAISQADAALITALQGGQTLLQAAEYAATLAQGYDPSPMLGLLFQAGALVEPDPALSE
jgi:hypothetical protein